MLDRITVMKSAPYQHFFISSGSPCKHGQCHDGINQYHCTCSVGYKGRNCDIDIDECSFLPCLNNATCIDEIGNFSCNCALGYEGMCLNCYIWYIL